MDTTIPPSPDHAHVGRFAFLAERVVWTNPPVRQNCPEQFGTAAGCPRSAQARRGRVHGWTRQSLPPPITPTWGVLRFWRRGWCGRTHRFDKIVRNNLGQPRAAPVARKREGVGSMDGHDNPSLPRSRPRGAFCVSGGEGGVDEPTG